MLKQGKVFWAKGKLAVVELEEECGGCRGCGEGARPAKMVEVDNELGAAIGERVEIEIQGPAVILAPLIAFGLPFFCIFLGLFIGISLRSGYTAFLVIGGAVIGMVLSALIDRSFGRRKKRWGRIVRKWQ